MKDYKQITKDVLSVIEQKALFLIVFFLVAHFINGYLDIGTDPTDKDGFNRSGLHYYKDHGTGIEYIGAGGCLIKRGE